MKLELKHLAPYLPYKLKIETIAIYGKINYPKKAKVIKELTVGNLWSFIDENNNPPATFEAQRCKPILRPLSDLKKEYIDSLEIGEDDSGTEFDHGNIKTIAKLKEIAEHNSFLDVQYLPYLLVDDLIKNHFDVFGLIEKNLAIDINTLNS